MSPQNRHVLIGVIAILVVVLLGVGAYPWGSALERSHREHFRPPLVPDFCATVTANPNAGPPPSPLCEQDVTP
jgi:hypothetical protein